MRNRSKWILCMGLAFTMAASVTLSGCGTGKKDSGKTEIELVQYKPEAVKHLKNWKKNSMPLMMISILPSNHQTML